MTTDFKTLLGVVAAIDSAFIGIVIMLMALFPVMVQVTKLVERSFLIEELNRRSLRGSLRGLTISLYILSFSLLGCLFTLFWDSFLKSGSIVLITFLSSSGVILVLVSCKKLIDVIWNTINVNLK